MARKQKGGSHGRRRTRGQQAPRETRAAGTTGETRAAAQAPAAGTGGSTDPAAPPPGRLRWWERLEDGGRDRYDRELEALRAAGYEPRPVHEHSNGILRITIKVPVRGTPTEMVIVYPALYPWFRFEVFTEAIHLRRHQHPASGALCLIDQGTINWHPATDLAATVISGQIGPLLGANESEGPYADEAPTPEPISMYFQHQPNSVFILPPEAYRIDPERSRGRMTIALANSPSPMRGYVAQIDGGAVTLPDLSKALPPRTQIEIDWIRIPPPEHVTADELAEDLVRAGVLRRPRPISGALDFDLVGLLFEEEIEYRDVMGPGWAFLLRTRAREGWSATLVRIERMDAGEQGSRIASVKGLADKTVFQAGAGGLGGPTTHLLAQSRLGTLRLADGDNLGLGNATRWPMGFAVAGLHKVLALRNLVAVHYPETRVEPWDWFIGRLGDHDDEAFVDRALGGVDLILDATAELGVQQFLAHQARERGVPFLMVEATPGAFGGIVALIDPDPDAPCWVCLQHAISDEAIRPPIDARAGKLQLAGCSTATFTGTAFDLVPLAAMTVRMAAAALSAANGYPRPDWNVAVLFNREDDEGTVGLTPRWEFHKLARHQKCQGHPDADMAA